MTIRFKLTMASIAVILVANAVLSLVGLEYAERAWLREVQYCVRLGLTSARATYDARIDRTVQYLGAMAAACRGQTDNGELVSREAIGAAFPVIGADTFTLLLDRHGHAMFLQAIRVRRETICRNIR